MVTRVAARSGPASLIQPLIACTFFAALTAVFARIAIPLPFTPVPFTLQPMAVVLTGMMLGPRLGAAAMVEYVVAGALGAPIFQGGTATLYNATFVTGTLGYLVSYPFAAAVVGLISDRGDRGMKRMILGGCAGLVVIYAFGVVYLAGWLNVVKSISGLDLVPRALIAGTWPFVVFDVVKVALAAAVAKSSSGIWRR